MKKKLKDLKQCPAILDLRPVNELFVSRYRQAMRSGDEFPRMTVDGKGQIISGNHRYEAMIAEYGEDHEVLVNVRKFPDEASRIEFAIQENARHGNPLDGISRKRAVLRLNELGRSAESIAKVLGVAVKRVEDMAGMSVIVVGGRGKANRTEPVKRGLEHMAGRKVTAKQYESHRTRDRAMPARQAAEQLIRWLEAGWVDLSDEATFDALADLHSKIGEKLHPDD